MGREQINEILTTLSTNKLRTVLTGFAVGWGVFLLVILLSSGMGLRNGIMSNFDAMGYNDTSAELEFGSLSIPYRGKPQWYSPLYTREDCDRIAADHPEEITLIAPYCKSYGNVFTYGARKTEGQLIGTVHTYAELKGIHLIGASSRFLNERDETERRKVIVLNKTTATSLFDTPEAALGKTIFLQNTPLTVVGVYKGNNGQWSPNFIPLSTAQTLKLHNNKLKPNALSGMYMQCPLISTEAEADSLERRLVRYLASVKEFSPEDYNTLYLSSSAADLNTANQITGGISIFLWIIGLSTLAIGVVGVVSIMQIAVTERRKEIGIRKALGARPWDIISMILMESVLITLVAGLGGLVVGVGIMAGVDSAMQAMGIGQTEIMDQTSYIFISPLINLETALMAILVMVGGGLLAGYLPARKATRIPTVEAMRR